MEMQFGQYCRIESAAGGVGCSEREFIRAAWSRLGTDGKSREYRTLRHAWLRDGLSKLKQSRRVYLGVMS